MAYELRISDWSSDVCSSDLGRLRLFGNQAFAIIGKKSLELLGLGGLPGNGKRPVGGGGRCACNESEGIGKRTARHRRSIEIAQQRSEEHTSELQSLMRISYAVFCLKKKKKDKDKQQN